jgi:cellulose synthase/poly-beta-1,6-N-acetylglucosamine synthase-like glycosyltransferase
MIIPGAGGAFRKDALFQCGRYDNDTVTEDFDVTVKLLKSKGRVVLVDAITYTDVPDNLRDLNKQRTRWSRGNMQTLLKHSNVVTNGRYGMLHKFGYPILSMAYWLPSILDFIIIGYMVYTVISGTGISFLLPFSVYIMWQIVLSAIALVLDGREDGKVLLYSPLAIVGYKQILNAINIKSMFGVLLGGKKNKRQKWQATRREASVAA